VLPVCRTEGDPAALEAEINEAQGLFKKKPPA
jgi:hypothetical protein